LVSILELTTMAGNMRQLIDVPSLERYLNQSVPEIKTPVDVKQASLETGLIRELI
jgi:hypothetical protein